MMPAFSPGPWTTSLLLVGNLFRWTREDLYEQCSLHITLKIPSSVIDGSRPSNSRLIFSYSSEVIPCSRMTSGVMVRVGEEAMRNLYCRIYLRAGRHRKTRTVYAQNRSSLATFWFTLPDLEPSRAAALPSASARLEFPQIPCAR